LDLVIVVLSLDGLALNLELFQPTADLIKLFGHRVALHTQLGGGLIHEVDGLVGQETVGDIAFRQLHGGNAGIVLYTHLVVVFIPFFQASQDGDGIHLIGLVDHHRLETTFQCLVFLKIFLVLVECRGSDGSEFAAGQRGLENVGGIHRSLSAAGTHEGVYLVDEQYDVAFGVCHLFDDALEPFLKLTLVFRSGHQGTHVERVELLVLQVLGHVATHDALGQSLNDGCLARSRLTY